jgi:putative transposase
VKGNQAMHATVTMCRVLGVSTSGYWAWRKRPLSEREKSDRAIEAQIEEIHRWSQGTYGVPRMHAELAARGTRVGRKRVAREGPSSNRPPLACNYP